MDKKMLQNTFKEFKKATVAAGVGVDYAISSPASFDSSTAFGKIHDKYGSESKGIWANRSEDLSKDDSICVNHDITEAQVGIFYSVFGEKYNIIPAQKDFCTTWAFQLFEKNTPVWAIHMDGDKITPHGVTASKEEAERRIMGLGVVVQRIF